MQRLGLGRGGEESSGVRSCLSPQALVLMWRWSAELRWPLRKSLSPRSPGCQPVLVLLVQLDGGYHQCHGPFPWPGGTTTLSSQSRVSWAERSCRRWMRRSRRR